MHGSQKSLLLKEKFMAEIARDPAFYLADVYDLSKDEIRERTMEKFASLVHYVTSEPLDVFNYRMQLISTVDPGFWTRFGVHFGLFLGAIRSGASPAQFNYWIEKGVIGLNGVIGCFGMTELAHGSNVAGVETTATFDEQTDEFIIHTPHLGATKWWIGGAASTATHCAVFAQLIVKGKKCGVKTFIVQLRDVKTFQLKPGVNIGDIGKKMGRDGIDNGYIQFTYVRVPRAHMLMKHTQVSREGIVTDPPLAQLTYGALLSGRIAMVADSSNTAKKALTIALRYAAVRRQFAAGKNQLETQLIDYPIHQRRLIPYMAQAIAIGFTSLILTKMYNELTEAMETLEPGDPNLKDVLEKLKETHSTSAGLKVRPLNKHSAHGHAWRQSTSAGRVVVDTVTQHTPDFPTCMQTLQYNAHGKSGRALVSSWADAQKGKPLAPGVAYMSEKANLTAKSDGKLDLADIDRAWACVAANVVKKAAADFASHAASGISKAEAMEMCSQSRFIAAKLHTIGYIFRMFRQACNEQEEGPEKQVLTDICRLYGLWQIEEQGASFLKYGYFTGEQMDKVQSEVDGLCLALRKVVIPVVDAFAISDHIINSPLGRYDGDVYTAYFNHVRAANPPTKEHPYFDRLIKPLLERKPLEEEDVDAAMGFSEELAELEKERKASKS
ncbi:hypothetical protein QFC19_001699 [Naganishia cerealis]|uniref:Uncharacterized protein n=1 Tax=Naganishia cerealis TaxID=610337 RepID=A0ACC2WGV6_9TREE|nr:hypothetical protein QFC19_001699 [Naganishia cerealis]